MDRERSVNALRNVGAYGWHSSLETLGGFKKFILRGNVVDLAVGIVIGAAFTAVINGMVQDLFQPLIGIPFNLNSFDTYTVGPAGHPFFVGKFIGAVITFLLTAVVLYFFVVLPVTKLHDRYNRLRPAPKETATTRECPFCLSGVPLKATRCAFCTAQLPPANVPSAGTTL